jgi:hypothetical protein
MSYRTPPAAMRIQAAAESERAGLILDASEAFLNWILRLTDTPLANDFPFACHSRVRAVGCQLMARRPVVSRHKCFALIPNQEAGAVYSGI